MEKTLICVVAPVAALMITWFMAHRSDDAKRRSLKIFHKQDNWR